MLFARKSLGLELSANGLAFTLLGGSTKAPRLDAFQAVPFPKQVVKLSRREPNVLDPQPLVTMIKEAHLRLLTKQNSVSVSIPDATGRVVLLDLEARFKNRDEALDIIRWKLKKSLPYDVSTVHLDYQTLLVRENGAISVLVSLISRPVITQYEELLGQAGLEATRIDFTSFNLYRLFATRLELAENGAFVTYYGGAMTMLIFFGGVLSFYRTKEAIADAQGLYREVNSSFLVYGDLNPGQSVQEVFCLAEASDAEDFRSVVAEASGLEPVLLDPGRLFNLGPGLSVDRETFHALSASLGAALRSF